MRLNTTAPEVLLTVCGVLTLLIAVPVGKQAPASDTAVDSYVRREMAERQIPGIALAVLQGDEVAKLAVYGNANLEFEAEVRLDTLFNVASVSKSVTGVAIMRLVEDGKITLDSPVAAYLPEVPARWHSVSVRQLLNHTSGLPVIDVDQYSTRTQAQTVLAAMEFLRTLDPPSPPGAQWTYSGTNYFLLGLIVERVTGQPFVDFCRDRLFAPLAITEPVFGDSRAIVPDRATVYTKFRFDAAPPQTIPDIEVLAYEMPPFAYPAAGLNISITDFTRWLVALRQGRVISAKSIRELWIPAALKDRDPAPYGLGWLVTSRLGRPVVGGTGGLRAAFFNFRNDDFTVVLFTNLQGARPESIIDGIAAIYLRQ